MISVNTTMTINNGSTMNVAMIQLNNAMHGRHSNYKRLHMGVGNFEQREKILWRQSEHI